MVLESHSTSKRELVARIAVSAFQDLVVNIPQPMPGMLQDASASPTTADTVAGLWPLLGNSITTMVTANLNESLE